MAGSCDTLFPRVSTKRFLVSIESKYNKRYNIYLKFFGHDDKTQLGLAFQRGLLLLFLFNVTLKCLISVLFYLGSILLALTGFVCSIALLNSKFILALVSDQPDVNE